MHKKNPTAHGAPLRQSHVRMRLGPTSACANQLAFALLALDKEKKQIIINKTVTGYRYGGTAKDKEMIEIFRMFECLHNDRIK
jgi:hypothetical protein